MIRYFIVLVGLTAFLPASAQKKELSTEQLLKGQRNAITQPLPQFIRWMDESHFLINRRTQGDKMETFLVDAKNGQEIPAPPTEAPATPGKKEATAVLKNGDIFLRMGSSEEQLTKTPEPERNPTLSPDKSFVAFTRANDFYTIRLSDKKEFRHTADGNDTILNGYASWVYMEEILGRATQYRAFWWSPDSKKLVFFRFNEGQVPIFNIVGETGQHGYTEATRYPKPGEKNPEVKVGFVPADGGAVVWADFREKDDQFFGTPNWKPDGSGLFVHWFNRGQDSLKTFEVNPATGARTLIYEETQKTWIDVDDTKRITFLASGKGFLLQSDKSGFNHLYLHDMSGKLVKQITEGRFGVTAVSYIDEKNQTIYFTCRKDNSARSDLYKVKFNGSGLQRLSFGDFTHSAILSPNADYFITTYSNASTPARMALVSNKGKLIKELGDAKGPDFDNTNFARTEILRVKSEDGLYDLPLRITWPLNYDKSKKYPLMINIYGGPDAGTVMDGWRLDMTSQWWAKEGLIQVAMDHRASGHFGKEGVNYMHRNLGYWEMKDWISIVKWLIENGSVDKNKVCIAGFSYGGYMACYALTYGADYFTHGLAGGSVTDWSLYDGPYTERFMDTPQENPEGYKSSSVFTHLQKYRGLLRIYHGTMDDNVHLQNSLQLIRKLQEMKKHFEFMAYPGARHGWGGNQNAHSTNENNMFIYRNLLEKPFPQDLMR